MVLVFILLTADTQARILAVFPFKFCCIAYTPNPYLRFLFRIAPKICSSTFTLVFKLTVPSPSRNYRKMPVVIAIFFRAVPAFRRFQTFFHVVIRMKLSSMINQAINCSDSRQMPPLRANTFRRIPVVESSVFVAIFRFVFIARTISRLIVHVLRHPGFIINKHRLVNLVIARIAYLSIMTKGVKRTNTKVYVERVLRGGIFGTNCPLA